MLLAFMETSTISATSTLVKGANTQVSNLRKIAPQGTARNSSAMKAPAAMRKRTKRQRRGARKPTDMPRRPLSAYNLFFKEHRSVILAELESREDKDNSGQGKKASTASLFSTMGKAIAKRWKELPEENLTRLKNLANEDMNRYRKEMNEYHRKLAQKARLETKPLDDKTEIGKESDKLPNPEQVQAKNANSTMEGAVRPVPAHTMQYLSSFGDTIPWLNTRQLLLMQRNQFFRNLPQVSIGQAGIAMGDRDPFEQLLCEQIIRAQLHSQQQTQTTRLAHFRFLDHEEALLQGSVSGSGRFHEANDYAVGNNAMLGVGYPGAITSRIYGADGFLHQGYVTLGQHKTGRQFLSYTGRRQGQYQQLLAQQQVERNLEQYLATGSSPTSFGLVDSNRSRGNHPYRSSLP